MKPTKTGAAPSYFRQQDAPKISDWACNSRIQYRKKQTNNFTTSKNWKATVDSPSKWPPSNGDHQIGGLLVVLKTNCRGHPGSQGSQHGHLFIARIWTRDAWNIWNKRWLIEINWTKKSVLLDQRIWSVKGSWWFYGLWFTSWIHVINILG